MNLIHVASAALNQTPLDWDGNVKNIKEAIKEARARGVHVLCLPELCLTGYGCEDAFFSVATCDTAMRQLHLLVQEADTVMCTVGLPVYLNGSVYNGCAILFNSEIQGIVLKQNLAGDGLHYEPRWFKPWDARHKHNSTLTDVSNEHINVGMMIFDYEGIRIGVEICQDAWVPNRPAMSLRQNGVDIILNPSASHFALGKAATRERLVVDASRAYGVAYVYSNLLGNEAGRAIYDGHTIIASGGQLLSSGDRLSFKPHTMIDAVIDVDTLRMQRSRDGNVWFGDLEVPKKRRLIVCEIWNDELSECRYTPPTDRRALWECSANLQFEEFSRAVALGLFDYLRKSRSKGFVVSLSGGADSSAVCCLIYLMYKYGVEQLGLDEFLSKVGINKDDLAESLEFHELDEAVMPHLLTTVYQSTAHSSASTAQSARILAEAIGVIDNHHQIEIDDIVNLYKQKAETILGRKLDWEFDNVTLQNIQARARGPSVWMIANARKALLLSTSNRSEAAVGYATMDGDTCGGLCPIAGIDKAFIRNWLLWLDAEMIPELRVVNQLTPTAELQPEDQHQTDETDLMPYPILDAIETEAITNHRSPSEVLEILSTTFDKVCQSDLRDWITKFFTLWSRNQWKRERYAPSFHLDDHNLDPKTWCRFPILSGGFRKELQEMIVHSHIDA